MRIDRYWDLELDPDDATTEDDGSERIRGAFEQAVTRQLISDVPVGSYLSGGMDSASIAASRRRSIPRLMTFTGGFDLSSVTGLELVFDERADAEASRGYFRTEHYEMVMHAGDMAWVLPELVWHLEDLRVGMCYQNYYIAGLASKFVKVALGRDGRRRALRRLPVALRARRGRCGRTRSSSGLLRLLDATRARRGASPTSSRREVWSRRLATTRRCELFRQCDRAGVASSTRSRRALYFEAKTFLHGLLVVEDKVSMAHSLEVRVPFLDNELVELARRIPTRLKHGDGGGKLLLRDAMARSAAGRDIVEKREAGLQPARPVVVPRARRWTTSARSCSIRAPSSEATSSRSTFEAVLAEHLEGRVNHRLLIWSLSLLRMVEPPLHGR